MNELLDVMIQTIVEDEVKHQTGGKQTDIAIERDATLTIMLHITLEVTRRISVYTAEQRKRAH